MEILEGEEGSSQVQLLVPISQRGEVDILVRDGAKQSADKGSDQVDELRLEGFVGAHGRGFVGGRVGGEREIVERV